MVSIFTYRDERKLFAVIGATIVAAVLALTQITAARSGKPSIFGVAVASVATAVESVVTATTSVLGGAASAVASVPASFSQARALERENASLRAENALLREEVSRAAQLVGIDRIVARYPTGIAATTIAFDLEGQSRTATIDRGSLAHVAVGDGVVDAEGAVGRIVATTPLSSTVLLLDDPQSKIPALVQRGRWWGIAVGTNEHVKIEYVSQDAPLRIGDRVVTAAGQSFAPGIVIGKIVAIDRPEGALYQSAIIDSAVAFGRLGSVLVVPR